MIRRTAQWLLVLALSFSIGLQWTLLQTAAWVGMVVSYSQETTLPRAVMMTFDGGHPCRWCRSVQEQGAAQQTQKMSVMVIKLEFTSPDPTTLVAPPHDGRTATALAAQVAGQRTTAPPTPPPERTA